MMPPEVLARQICSQFCGDVRVLPTPAGYAISSPFRDSSGDLISFHLVADAAGLRIEDDGSYLAELVARDVPFDNGARAQLLDAILQQADAFWDRETFEIKTPAFDPAHASRRVLDFLSAMIRVRDLELITRDFVRSTFRDDALLAIRERFGKLAAIEENAAIGPGFQDFPADVVIRPSEKNAVVGAVFFVSTNDNLNEALLLQTQLQLHSSEASVVVFGLIEEPDMKAISRKKFQRAQNRSLTMPIYRGDEQASMQMIARGLHLPQEHTGPMN